MQANFSHQKLLMFEIEYCSPIPLALLSVDSAIDQITKRHFHENSLIYFITKVKKVRFDYSSIRIKNDRIRVDLSYDDKTVTTDFRIVPEKKITLLDGSSNKILILEFEGADHPKPMVVTPDLVLRQLNHEIGNKPELIYIGYSIEPIRRLKSHEKIVKASAEISDNEEIRIYINSLKFSFMEYVPNKTVVSVGNIGLKKGKVKDEVLKTYIRMVERILIHFFQTGSLNDNHINMDIMNDPILKKTLQDSGIRFFGGGVDMFGGEYFDFWSANQLSPTKKFFYDFENPHLGYISPKQFFELYFIK